MRMTRKQQAEALHRVVWDMWVAWDEERKRRLYPDKYAQEDRMASYPIDTTPMILDGGR